MAVGKVKIQRIAADDADVVEFEIVRDALVTQDLFAGPFIDTRRTGA